MSARARAAGDASPRILIVEDERIVAMDLAGTLDELGYEIAGTATRGEEAVELTARLDPSLVLMDVRLAGKMDGIEAAQSICEQRDVPIVYLTAHSDNETLQRAAQSAALGYLMKPFKSPELRSVIVRATSPADASTVLDVQCDELSLPVDKAIACGLILNELITNALKHAYPAGGGPLKVELRHNAGRDAGRQVRLIVTDQGVGMPPQPSHQQQRNASSSLGLQLVSTLTEQLGGTLSIEQCGGTTVSVSFPVE